MYKRRPNPIVRGLYIVFEFFGDFVPMFDALFSFLGRTVLILVNLIILASAIIISAAHSLELMRYAGMRGGLEWVGMVAFELTFIFSSHLLDKDFRRRNWKSGWATWTGFLMGVVFVGFSNYMGMAHNKVGRTIGLAIPALLIVSKGLLMHQARQRAEAAQEHDAQNQMGAAQDEPPTQERMGDSQEWAPTQTKVGGTQNETPTQPHLGDAQWEATTRITSPKREEATAQAWEPTQWETASQVKTAQEMGDAHREEASHWEEHSHPDTPAQQMGGTQQAGDAQTGETAQMGVGDLGASQGDIYRPEEASQKQAGDSQEEAISQAIECALSYQKEHDKLPSRRKLAEMANCSEWIARKALQQLQKTG